MPCDQVIMNRVELDHVKDLSLLADALSETEGFTVTGTTPQIVTGRYKGIAFSVNRGTVTVRQGYEHIADAIKQAYAKKAVKVAAKKYGFTVKQQGAMLQLQRR